MSDCCTVLNTLPYPYGNIPLFHNIVGNYLLDNGYTMKSRKLKYASYPSVGLTEMLCIEVVFQIISAEIVVQLFPLIRDDESIDLDNLTKNGVTCKVISGDTTEEYYNILIFFINSWTDHSTEEIKSNLGCK